MVNGSRFEYPFGGLYFLNMSASTCCADFSEALETL